MKKENNMLKVIITIIAIALILAIAYVSYHYISMFAEKTEAEVAANEFENEVTVVAIEDEAPENIVQEQAPEEPDNQSQTSEEQNTSTSQNKTKETTIKYKEYSVIGTIQIPKTNVKSVIVDRITPQSISAAVGVLYGPGPNKIGNTVLAAHNYRNGTFFSNNKNLTNGDRIFITDQDGLKVEYEVYKSYITEDTDISYAKRNTNR